LGVSTLFEKPRALRGDNGDLGMGHREKEPSGAEFSSVPSSSIPGANCPRDEPRPGKPQEVSAEHFQAAVEGAHRGSLTALGALFEECRDYLLLVANRQLGGGLQAKIGASDLVQETFLQAQEIFGRFEGHSKDELLAWLKRILEFKLAQATRTFVATQMRQAGLEVPIDFVAGRLVSDVRRPDQPTPGSWARRSENQQKLVRALDRLPPDYRLAIGLRSFEHKSFAELGATLQRSAAAARMVWVRALAQLELELQRIGDSSEPSRDQPRQR
jgi:RNA polymerase sigma-70 factor, ECF subfamily